MKQIKKIAIIKIAVLFFILTGLSINKLSAQDLEYDQDFSDFVFSTGQTITTFGNDDEWTFEATGGGGNILDYNGDWGEGFHAGFRGNDNVLGYQHTSNTGTFYATLTLTNNTGQAITMVSVSYLGRVERDEEGRSPEWTVTVDGQVVGDLSYSTQSNEDEIKSADVPVSVAAGDDLVIVWSSDRGGPSGSSKQIGIADVSISSEEATQVGNPVFNPPAGTYYDVQYVRLSTVTEDADIYYTLNGDDPTESDILYETPIYVDGTTTIKARAFRDDLDPSNIVTAEYIIESQLLLSKDFEDQSLYSGGWTVYDVYDGANTWVIDSWDGVYFAQITEYESSPEFPESYLISPEIEINEDLENVVFSFENTVSFASGQPLSAIISTDYSGEGDPENATWTTFDATYDDPDGTHGNWTFSGDISLEDYSGETVHIAFHYLSDANNVGRWRVNNILITSDFLAPAEDDANLTVFTLGGKNVLNLDNIVVNDPDDDGAVLEVENFIGFYGVEVYPRHIDANFTVHINGNEISHDDLENFDLSEGDVVLVTVISADESTTKYYKATLELGDIPGAVTTIAALREGDIGEEYTFIGEAVMTFRHSYRNQMFIQDNTAAIMIDDPSGNLTTTYNIGDGITNIKGVLDSYGGMLQFQPVEDPGPASSIGNPIVPQEITLSDITSEHQALLIKVKNLEFESTGNFETGTIYDITDPSNPPDDIVFRTNFFNADYIGDPIPTDKVHLVALVTEHFDLFQITARSSYDFHDPVSVNNIDEQNIVAYPNPFSNNLTLRINENVTKIELTNSLGQKIKDFRNTGHELQINTSELTPGIYFVRFVLENGNYINKKLIKQ